MNRVLVLGAGMVASPLIRYLLDLPGVAVTVAAMNADEVRGLVSDRANGQLIELRIEQAEKLDELVADHDVIVSLLPAMLHAKIAERCVARKRHLVTTSYVSSPMRDLDAPATAAGVMLLNEMGLDPGLDHMSAMKLISHVKDRGGKVVAFYSCCGGLPAPECKDNPWSYKFSWRPRAVCLAGKRPARYLADDEEVVVPTGQIFNDCSHGRHVEGVGDLIAYPNGDATSYIAPLGLEGIRTMFRGTFRYPGWCETMRAISDLGLLDETPTTYPAGTTYASFLSSSVSNNGQGLRQAIADKLGIDSASPALDRLEWLGLFSDEPIDPAGAETSPIDVLANRMGRMMPYREGERDMIVLMHELQAEFPDGATERQTSTLIAYGNPEDSAMARLVSLPAAVGVKLILDGKVCEPGVHIPVEPEIYVPVLAELEEMGIRFAETVAAE